MQITIGQKAPDFSLYDTTKTKISLGDLRGQNVLLLFFPQAFTSVCTRELCTVRDNISLYNNANACILGISVDSVYTLAKYKEEQKLNFSLLSDFNKEVSAAYNSLYDTWKLDMKGVSKRSAFLIDKEKIIRYVEILENASDEPDFLLIKDSLAELD